MGDVMRDAVTINEDISLSMAADLIVQKKANRLVGHLSLLLYPLLVDLVVLVVWMYVCSQVSTQRAQLKCAVIMHACKSVLPTSKVQACSKTRQMDYV